jgi:hypothetical protein
VFCFSFEDFIMVDFLQVSSDLSIIDLDVPFALMFGFSSSLNAYSNLGVIAIVTWQVLFVSLPMIVLAIRLQVIHVAFFPCMAKLFSLLL